MKKEKMIKLILGYIVAKRLAILIFAIGFLSYGYYLTTLVTTFFYYIIFLIVAFLICLFWGTFKSEKTRFEKVMFFFKIYLILYFIFFSIFFLTSKFHESKIFVVPLNGYSTAKTDAIYFSFGESKFKRYYNLSRYPLDSLKVKYSVELDLSEPLPNIYFINSIKVAKSDLDR